MAGIGYAVLFLALLASVFSAIAYIFGVRKRHPVLIKSARFSLFITFGLVSASASVLLISLLTHNFQIEYVASYTSRDLHPIYLVSAFWAGNDGSLLFWAWLLSLFVTILVLQRRNRSTETIPYAYAIIMLTEAFFLILLLSVSNPFHEFSFLHTEGSGLNPILENPGMIFHPPTLLAGYAGLAIPFALAISALMTRKFNDGWIIIARKWTLLSWLLLGIGNIIGAWWAYVELGWGGYWAWDPVENAGLMPWLVGTAFLHSIMIQKRKGMFKVWNMVLIILAFNLSIFGTFLTRSGILSSVHTFGETSLGPFFLVFIGITFLGSMGLLYYRRKDIKGKAEIKSLISREGTLQLNNLLLVGAALVIFAGTVFPAISEAVRGVKISMGESFFNQTNGPIFLAIILLVGVCTLIGWQWTSIKKLIRSSLWPLAAALILGTCLFVLGIREWYALISLSLCGFTLFAILCEWFREIKTHHRTTRKNYLKTLWKLIRGNRPHYGAYIVHIAIIFIAIGVIGSSSYDVEKEATLKPDESIAIKNYTLSYDGITYQKIQSQLVVTATLSIYNGDEFIDRVTPEKYFHRGYDQAVTEVAIHTNPLEDIYVILIGWEEDGAAAFKVLVNPLVVWIWIGGGLLLSGGLIALWPEAVSGKDNDNGQ